MGALLAQQLVNALTIGSIYALIALGYTMVYGVLRLINFAHSELFTLGPYLVLALLAAGGAALGTAWLPLLAVMAFVLVGLVGVGVERLAYRPLRSYSRLAPMLSALGCSIVLQNAIMLMAGRRPLPFPDFLPSHPLNIAGAVVDVRQLVILGAAVVLMGGLWVYVHATTMGLRIRAVAENHVTARLVGIPVDGVVRTVFFIGPGLGAVAGLLYASYYGVITFNMGFAIGLKAFTAAVLGGIGSIPGAMLGGFLLGILETFGAGVLPILTDGASQAQYRDIFAFSILMLVLIFRPAGLLGSEVSEESMAARKDY